MKGQLKAIKQLENVTATFSKRVFAITDNSDPARPNTLAFELYNQKIKKIDGYAIGDSVKVSFGISGREWRDSDGTIKYFTTLVAFDVEKA